MAGVALGDIQLRFTWQAWHKLTSTVVLRGRRGTYDHDYIPGMITSHRACGKSSQNLRLRPKECRTLLWSAEVWRAHHRFDRGLCHKRSFGKQRREKKPSEPGGARRRRVRHVVRPSVQHTPLDPQRISVVSISCFFSGLQ